MDSVSIYPLDRTKAGREGLNAFSGRRVFFDGVFKGDYSLAIVNRELAAALIEAGVDLSIFTDEPDWHDDPLLNARPQVRRRCLDAYPPPGVYDIHLRNTWPPTCQKMIGQVNAYVCFAWEEAEFPQHIVDEFNQHLDLVMVTARFVETALRQSGVVVPVFTVGNGTDHLSPKAAFTAYRARPAARTGAARLLHISSCFPRKGADLLVRAFASEFQHQDNVELVIKTFANPHNDIQEVVDGVRRDFPTSAPIHVRTEHLAPDDLRSLIRSAQLLIAPSRGEGFGLPLAEAILLGTPIATTNYSGQLDFCTPETAWLIDYHLVPSAAHVAGSGSVWAEPSLDSLRHVMRSALEQKRVSQHKVRQGQMLLKAHFKWSDVARRVGAALAMVSSVKSASPAGNLLDRQITLVSSWGQVCGIATYAQHLFGTPALRPALRRVLAREIRGDALPVDVNADAPQVQLSRPWGYEREGVERLAADLKQDTSPIIWIQHHPGFFSGSDMLTILSAARANSSLRCRLVTLHNSRAAIEAGGTGWLDHVDLVFVHTAQDAQIISKTCPQVDVRVIPHGIMDPMVIDEPDPLHFTVGSFGFLMPHKNIPKLLLGFAKAFAYEPRLRLRLLNSVRSDMRSQIEQAVVQQLIQELDIGHVVDFRAAFLADQEVLSLLQQCDILCFPYGESDESASGAIRIALTADRPVICSQASVLADVHNCGLKLATVEPEVIAEALLLAAGSAEIRHAFDQRRRKFTAWHRYDRVAVRYAQTIGDYLGQ